MRRLDRRYQICFLLFVVLGLFYPAIFATENSVDDWSMLQRLIDQKFDAVALFTPSGGFYYRPILMLTFWFDIWCWDGRVSFMHLENILLHAANVLLVYFLAQQFFKSHLSVREEVYMLAALLFAVHPITTESVNWISGRTDLLGTFFVLLTALVTLRAGSRNSLPYVALASIFFLCAVMSKEVMVFFFPVACVLLWFSSNKGENPFRLVIAFASPFLLLAVLYVLARIYFLPDSARGLSTLLSNWHYGPYDTVRVVFKVFGFYVKKLFIPVPLNFAIRQVSDLYVILGIASLVLIVVLSRKNVRKLLPLAISFWMITPAILVALTNVAWTPLAERYIYLSSAFVAVAFVPIFCFCSQLIDRKLAVLSVGLLLFGATAVTAQRNLVWQDNLRLHESTKEYNPDFSPAHNEVGLALYEKGLHAEAEKVFIEAIESGMGQSQKQLYINLARIYLDQNDFTRAHEILRSSFENYHDSDVEVLKMYVYLCELASLNGDTIIFPSEKDMLTEMTEIYNVLYMKTGDTGQLYRSGQLFLGLNKRKRALQIFEKVAEVAPPDSYYLPAAKKLSERLARE